MRDGTASADVPVPFRFGIERSGRRNTVRLAGELDLSAVRDHGDEIRAAVAGASGKVGLDLGAVTFADSTALRLLVDLRRESEDRGVRLVIVQISEPVARLFEAAGLLTWFDFARTGHPRMRTCPMCEGRILGSSRRCARCGSVL